MPILFRLFNSLLAFLVFMFLAAIKPALAACSPPSDYTGCARSYFGTNLAGFISPQNFEALRQAANQNPDNVNKLIQTTIILTKETIADSGKLNQTISAAKQNGVELTIRIWTQDQVTAQQAKDTASTLSSALANLNMLDSRVEFGNESNMPFEGYEDGRAYGAAFIAFVNACTGCNLYLPTLGGAPGSEDQKRGFANTFLNYVKQNDPGAISKVNGIMFNSLRETPLLAVKDWADTLSIWKQASSASVANLNFSTIKIFLTEVGPPEGNKDWPNLNQFLTETAKLFSEIKKGGAICNQLDCNAFKNVEGFTFFIWDGHFTKVVYVDEKGNLTVRDLLSAEGNLGGSGTSSAPASSTQSLRSFPEESEQLCPNKNLVGGGGNPTYTKANGEKEQAFKDSAGLNYGTSVRGANCGQTKSQPLSLEEVAPFKLDNSKCKTVAWSGEIKIAEGNTKSFVLPFAKEIGDHWAGKGFEHYKKDEDKNIFQQAVGFVSQLLSPNQGGAEPKDAGALKKLSSGMYQDQLKCSFINYVKNKGTSAYKGAIVDPGILGIGAKKLTDLTCPPAVLGNPDPTENANWRKANGEIWAKLGLFPDEKSSGEIKFVVCEDKIYNLDVAYPDVFRLGLASNELYKTYMPKEIQDSYYIAGGGQGSFDKLLDKNKSLAIKPLNGASRLDRLVGLVKNATLKILSFVAPAFAETPPLQVAVYCNIANNVGEYRVDITNNTGGGDFSADVSIRNSSGAELEKYHIGGPNNALPGNTVSFGSPGSGAGWTEGNPAISMGGGASDVVFTVKYNGQSSEGNESVRRCNFASGKPGPAPAPPPPACGPGQCCETGECQASCKICNLGQNNPSDTSVWTEGYSYNKVPVGQTDLSFKIPDWKPGEEPLPPGCRLINVCSPNNAKCIANAEYCDPFTGKCGDIKCEKTHNRVVDVFNKVPFLSSIWKQSASKDNGFLNIFKSAALSGIGLKSTITGCLTDTNLVLDSSGNFGTNPGFSEVKYKFNQLTGKPDVEVSQGSPNENQGAKLTFYRLGGLCNADSWVSQKLLGPLLAR